MIKGCRTLAVVTAVLCSGSAALAESGTISGRIVIAPALVAALEPGDRLVLKLYRPDGGIEKDTRYWIIDSIELPRPFEIAPSMDMNGRMRWPAYRLDVFTDRDGDVLSAAPGELFASTGDLVPLGASGLELELTLPED